MIDSPVKKIEPKKSWTLTPSAFDRLLSWLNEGEHSADTKYLEMHRRLIAYFDRKNCLAPDELADETLNRVARRLDEEGNIESETSAKYCYIVARFVFMEYLRARQKENSSQLEITSQSVSEMSSPYKANDEKEVKERLLRCLDRCTQKLASPNRELILRYYVGKERVKIENRRAQAAELGVTLNALAVRACRIRDKLETCVSRCAATE